MKKMAMIPLSSTKHKEYIMKNIGELMKKANNDFSEILDKVTLYPVLRFRLCGKIF